MKKMDGYLAVRKKKKQKQLSKRGVLLLPWKRLVILSSHRKDRIVEALAEAGKKRISSK